MPSTGERLRAHRLAAGISQEELARRAGISRRTVQRIEAGGTPRFMPVLKLARALDVSMDSFLTDTSPEYELEARISRFRCQLDEWGSLAA